MTDSLWTLGKRWKMRGIDSPFANIPQSIEREDLALIRQDIQAAGQQIAKIGTPASQPPVIIVILGTGKTSQGSQSMLAHLPIESISLHQLKETFLHGDRKKVYQCVLEVSDMFRWKSDSPYDHQNIDDKNAYAIYLREPQYFESNLDQIFPYATILMNCILWGPDYPRLLDGELPG